MQTNTLIYLIMCFQFLIILLILVIAYRLENRLKSARREREIILENMRQIAKGSDQAFTTIVKGIKNINHSTSQISQKVK